MMATMLLQVSVCARKQASSRLVFGLVDRFGHVRAGRSPVAFFLASAAQAFRRDRDSRQGLSFPSAECAVPAYHAHVAYVYREGQSRSEADPHPCLHPHCGRLSFFFSACLISPPSHRVVPSF